LSLTWPIDFWAQLRRIDQNDHFKHEDHTFDATLMLVNFMLDKLYLIIITSYLLFVHPEHLFTMFFYANMHHTSLCSHLLQCPMCHTPF